MIETIQTGSSMRQTHATAANDTSSWSHAVCTIQIYETVYDRDNHPKTI